MTESAREGMGGMAAEEGDRTKDADSQAAGVAPRARLPREADELAVDLTSERAGELERIALTAPEDARGAEERRRDVDHPHLVLPLITLGDPRRLTGGYLYHLRMAEAAPAHEAEIRFLSFPEWPFPLAALRGRAVLRRTEELGRARSCSTRSQLPSRVRPWRCALSPFRSSAPSTSRPAASTTAVLARARRPRWICSRCGAPTSCSRRATTSRSSSSRRGSRSRGSASSRRGGMSHVHEEGLRRTSDTGGARRFSRWRTGCRGKGSSS